MELVLGKELEAGQWTDRLYVISELAVGNSVILNDALIYTLRYVIAANRKTLPKRSPAGSASALLSAPKSVKKSGY